MTWVLFLSLPLAQAPLTQRQNSADVPKLESFRLAIAAAVAAAVLPLQHKTQCWSNHSVTHSASPTHFAAHSALHDIVGTTHRCYPLCCKLSPPEPAGDAAALQCLLGVNGEPL